MENTYYEEHENEYFEMLEALESLKEDIENEESK